MKIGKYLLAAALASVSASAGAAITVIGSTSARLCFEAADSRGTIGADSIARCDQALETENLSSYDTVATYVNRGILKLRLGQLDAAIADFDAAIARDPNQPEAYLNKGMAVLRQPEGWSAALPLFTTAIEKRTRRPAVAYFGRAVAHEVGGEIKEAYLDYRQASQLDPNWSQPRSELTRFTVRQP